MTPLITSLGIPSGVAGWDMIKSKTPSSFPALTNDPVIKQQIAYFEQNAPKATTAKALMSNPQLQDFVLTAYGLTSESGMTAFMEKVLNSNTTQSNSFARQLTNTTFTKIASDFNYGGTDVPAQPAVASSAEVGVSGLFQQSNFSSFSGTFGGVSVSNVNLSGVSTYQGLASALQTAFQQADGNKSNITVTLDGLNLKFSDSQGRGTANNFSWTPNPANTYAAPVASAPTDLINGATATAQVGGPSVTTPSFIQQVVQKYTEAQFQVVVGDTSNTLREALYAQQQLPSVTNWYQVMASQPLSNVIQTVLGLPSSFGLLPITKQNQVLSQRMNISEFQNPTKLSQMLTQFVALGTAQESQSSTGSTNPAVMLLNANSSSGSVTGNSILSTLTNDSMSSGSSAAMLFSTSL